MKTLSSLLSLIGMLLVLTVSAQNQNPTVTIYDIQYTADPYGVSPYEGQTVNVTGIVTSSAQIYDLGYIYIQDEGGGPWSGIMLTGSIDIIDLYRGEEVTITGIVNESFGKTVIVVSSATLTGQLKEIVVSDLDPSDSTSYISNGWEKWESVLVQYKDPGGNKLFISHPKLDEVNDFGDYAASVVSNDRSKKLGLILAGRVTSSSQSSLWVSIVTDSVWIDNSGQMQVPAIITTTDLEMDAVIGILGYGFSDYRLLPRNNDDFININIELEPTNLPGSPLAVNDHEKEIFSIYPNPCDNFIKISFESKEKTDLNIYDVTGRHVFYQKLADSNDHIDVSTLKTGTYIIQLQGKEAIYHSMRLVKLH